MIQDMFEPEYYLSRYETIDTSSGVKVTLRIVVDNVGYQRMVMQLVIVVDKLVNFIKSQRVC